MSLFFGLLAPLLLTLPDPGLAQDATFDSAGVSIRYVEAGTGETTIVLLHDFAGNADLFALDGMLVVLATRWRVVALDARGHGRSDKPHEPAAYGREMTEDVVRLLDHLGVQRAHVLGYSMGGMLALDLLTRHPERVLSAVVGGCGLPEPAVHGALMESVARALDAGAGFQPLVARLAAGTRVPPSPERLAVLERALLAANDPRALAAVARGFEQLLPAEASLRANTGPVGLARFAMLRSWLSQWSIDDTRAHGVKSASNITVPFLAIENTADAAVPQPHTGKIHAAAASKDKTMKAIKGATHYYQGQPELLKQAVEINLGWMRERNFLD
jgi:pimeloyl-ACP methyl ester carboxylesterase